ncbi:MAG: type II toxin-antitoxin system PrlF family antitoxin [Methanobrevibacter sp.]|nr:type II toxin-antitoxin system PrlF family antitoxin [Methanobrevibacter sp.]
MSDNMITTTKFYNRFQTVVPLEIRKKMNISPDDIIEWHINDYGKVELNFRTKVTEKDIVGMIKEKLPYDAVEIKKRGAKGLK